MTNEHFCGIVNREGIVEEKKEGDEVFEGHMGLFLTQTPIPLTCDKLLKLSKAQFLQL